MWFWRKMLNLKLNDSERRINYHFIGYMTLSKLCKPQVAFQIFSYLGSLWFLYKVSRCEFLFVFPAWKWLTFFNSCGWYLLLVFENSQPFNIQVLPLGQNNISSGNCFKIHQQRKTKRRKNKWTNMAKSW